MWDKRNVDIGKLGLNAMDGQDQSRNLIYNERLKIVLCQECRLGIERRYAQDHLTRTHGFNLLDAELIVAEVYNHDVVTFKDLNQIGPLEEFERILVFKCADCGHLVESRSGHYKHAQRSGHARKTHKVSAQRVFPNCYLEVAHEPEETNRRRELFEQLYPEEPVDDIVQSMGVGMDDELLRRAGWSTLMEGRAASDVLKLLEKPKHADDGVDRWIMGGWKILGRVEPSLLAYVENCEKPELHTIFKAPESDSGRRHYRHYLTRFVQFGEALQQSNLFAYIPFEGHRTHDVLCSLLLHVRDWGQRNDMELVNLYAAACLIREDGHFAPPSNITSVLAAMKHFIKLAVIRMRMSRGGSPIMDSRVWRVTHLDPQRSTPYGTLSRLQGLMSHGAYKEQRMPSWVWKREGVLVNGMLMVTDVALRSLAQQLMARSREALEAVLTEHCVRPDFVGRDDLWGSTEKHYGFARRAMTCSIICQRLFWMRTDV